MRYKNNPANIRYNKKNNWLGQVGSDNGFCVFDNIEHGLRALVILLRNYINVYKLHSVSEIISRYAPACENDTRNYISYVNGFLRSRGVDNRSFLLPCLLCSILCCLSVLNILLCKAVAEFFLDLVTEFLSDPASI